MPSVAISRTTPTSVSVIIVLLGDQSLPGRFDVFVVGDDWNKKYDYLKDLGVDVVYFPYGKGVSSTNLKRRIVARHDALTRRASRHFDINTVTGPAPPADRHRPAAAAGLTVRSNG